MIPFAECNKTLIWVFDFFLVNIWSDVIKKLFIKFVKSRWTQFLRFLADKLVMIIKSINYYYSGCWAKQLQTKRLRVIETCLAAAGYYNHQLLCLPCGKLHFALGMRFGVTFKCDFRIFRQSFCVQGYLIQFCFNIDSDRPLILDQF